MLRTVPRRSAALLACLLAQMGCSEDAGQVEGEETACGPDEVEVAEGVCCPLGTHWLPDGACRAVGVPQDGCGDGFVSDGAFGCNPTLPAIPCPPGQLATPGDETCREVAPCGEGPWGDIPVDATTQYVDASHGGASDGSPTSPWTTIADAVAAAVPSAIVAIAAGTYPEDVRIEQKPVRLWGRCPAMVEIRGTGGEAGAIVVDGAAATATEVHDLAISGSDMGLVVTSTEAVVADRLWIHDTGSHGVHGEHISGATSVIIRGTLVEAATEGGVVIAGAAALVERSSIRDTREAPYSTNLAAQPSAPGSGGFANLTVTQSAITGAQVGIAVSGATLTLDSVYVGRTAGRALGIRQSPSSGDISNVTATRSVFEQAQLSGIVLTGSAATFDCVVVRDITPDGLMNRGTGIFAQDNAATGARANLTLSRSTVERTLLLGIGITESDGLLEQVVVSGTAPATTGFGDGLAVVALLESSKATMTQMFIAESARAGVSSFGGQVTMSQASLWCSALDLNGESQYELGSGPKTIPFAFDDLGDNLCSCGTEPVACKVLSSGLKPPPPLE